MITLNKLLSWRQKCYSNLVPLWNTISTHIQHYRYNYRDYSYWIFAVTRENVKLKKLQIAYRVSITAVEVDNVLQ